MKVRIGNLEVSDLTLEELDALVQRYGTGAETPLTDPPLLPVAERVVGGGGGADGLPTMQGNGRVLIGGKWMTPSQVAEYRNRLASPTPLPGIDND